MELRNMAVNFSVKDVPDDIAEALRERARRNHRSLQGELMAMIEGHVRARPFRAVQLLDRIRAMGLQTQSESARFVREDRDAR